MIRNFHLFNKDTQELILDLLINEEELQMSNKDKLDMFFSITDDYHGYYDCPVKTALKFDTINEDTINKAFQNCQFDELPLEDDFGIYPSLCDKYNCICLNREPLNKNELFDRALILQTLGFSKESFIKEINNCIFCDNLTKKTDLSKLWNKALKIPKGYLCKKICGICSDFKNNQKTKE